MTAAPARAKLTATQAAVLRKMRVGAELHVRSRSPQSARLTGPGLTEQRLRIDTALAVITHPDVRRSAFGHYYVAFGRK